MPEHFDQSFSRRQFLGQVGLGAAALAVGPTLGKSLSRCAAADAAPRKIRVAAIFTVLRFRSHTFNILENFLGPYLFNGQTITPNCEVVSFYADQFPENDMTHSVSKDFNIPLFSTIGDAMRVGGKELGVDAVLLIGEHGEYPINEFEQTEYPRKKFFDEIVAVMRQSKRYVPIFNDKHFSYRWDWSKEMYDTCQELKIPFMAGSSVPLAQRIPAWELPAGRQIVEAVSIHGGGAEVYGFHGLEVLQSVVESRPGGETGIKRIQTLKGPELWKAAEEGRWSPDVAEAALAAESDARKTPKIDLKAEADHGILVDYKDGLKGIVLKVGTNANRWNFGCRLESQKAIHATAFYNGPWGNRCLFKALSHAIQDHFAKGQSPYPLERTLLTTGATEVAVKSLHAKGKPIDTPELEIAYKPRDYRAFRETGESWKIITEQTPEPKTIAKPT